MRRFAIKRWAWIALLAFSGVARAASVVDATTLNNKVIAGYQGWFMTSNDGSRANCNIVQLQVRN